MEFTWDPAKRANCLAKRRIDFQDAARIFDGRVLERIDWRRDYGEVRVIAIGRVDGLTITVIYTDRPDLASGRMKRRIITAWRSNAYERKAYSKACEGP